MVAAALWRVAADCDYALSVGRRVRGRSPTTALPTACAFAVSSARPLLGRAVFVILEMFRAFADSHGQLLPICW